MGVADDLIAAGDRLCERLKGLSFSPPVEYVYNPLEYASKPNHTYIRRYGDSQRRVVAFGMNPGPFGMSQTGVPFGDISMVRDWLGIEEDVGRPETEHPKRLISGFECARSEVSGSRLWGAIRSHFGEPDAFFREAFIVNYCPLVFMEDSGRNRTPDKLPKAERLALFEACDEHLRAVVAAMRPAWLIGVGAFAAKRAKKCAEGTHVRTGTILHPSPANPLANKNWEGNARRQLAELGVCADAAGA
jgi:single-strand selective monofunctional uracil DNA glycosylase